MKKYKYRDCCKNCGKKIYSNWKIGATSVKEKLLRHQIKEHGYVPTKEEKQILGSIA